MAPSLVRDDVTAATQQATNLFLIARLETEIVANLEGAKWRPFLEMTSETAYLKDDISEILTPATEINKKLNISAFLSLTVAVFLET